MKILLLFTEYFPYGNSSEHAFLQNEVKYLCDKFDQLIVFPSYTIGTPTHYENLEVSDELALALKSKHYGFYPLLALRNNFLYKELLSKKPSHWTYRKLKRLVYYLARAQITKEWFEAFVETSGFHDTDILTYTFWNTEVTLAIASLDRFTVVSRAHGHDLYENYKDYFGYLPCYEFTLQHLSRLYLVSHAAADYLSKKYPLLSKKFCVRHLGVAKAKSPSKPSADGVIRIASCSFIKRRKRLDLIVSGIKYFIDNYQKPVHWTHFGDGDESETLAQLVRRYDNPFFEHSLTGFVTNSEILEYYTANPIDIFITTSETEGGVPVALQEAQAYGIPVIGTNTGGIPEIVNEDVGVLLSKDPTEVEIADAINFIHSDRERFLQMRMNSIQNWQENFDQKRNYELFSTDLMTLFDN